METVDGCLLSFLKSLSLDKERMSTFGSGISRQRYLQITEQLQVMNSNGTDLFDASAEDDVVEINAVKTNIEGQINVGDRFFPYKH